MKGVNRNGIPHGLVLFLFRRLQHLDVGEVGGSLFLRSNANSYAILHRTSWTRRPCCNGGALPLASKRCPSGSRSRFYPISFGPGRRAFGVCVVSNRGGIDCV